MKEKQVKTARLTARIAHDVWLAARKRAFDEGIQFQTLIERALSLYLKTKGT